MSLALENLRAPKPTERPDLWPWSAKFADGELTLGGWPVTKLVEQCGSPVYVLYEPDLVGRATVWATVMAEDRRLRDGRRIRVLCEAMMSARIDHQTPYGVDTASLVNSRLRCTRALIEHDGLHGNNKSDEELRPAISAGSAASPAS